MQEVLVQRKRNQAGEGFGNGSLEWLEPLVFQDQRLGGSLGPGASGLMQGEHLAAGRRRRGGGGGAGPESKGLGLRSIGLREKTNPGGGKLGAADIQEGNRGGKISVITYTGHANMVIVQLQVNKGPVD